MEVAEIRMLLNGLKPQVAEDEEEEPGSSKCLQMFQDMSIAAWKPPERTPVLHACSYKGHVKPTKKQLRQSNGL